ncbi:hypothetical protein [Streptomyces parvulus]|uniref:Uncharacterized protein n=1 Tax=Streptomyces parvulus TaxID=146923 RepID=A0A191VB69_9ACTN|nr:hypothetical protein [Streptomyces parvulus]ANJ12123.1 hypothetical protein Spa2297_34205 [Streptomyces parvulus]GGS06112.1 hypothetical protein GCM10010220_67820 [Streptomyces parvulus]
MRNVFLAAPVDMSKGFKDFFDTIGLTGGGLVTKGIPAVLSIIALGMLLSLSGDPKSALIKGAKAVGTLFVAVVLALYGDTLFSTVTEAKG